MKNFKLFIFFGLTFSALCLSACSGNQSNVEVSKPNNSNAETNAKTNVSTDQLTNEKQKLEQEKQKLEQEKAKLNKEKKEVADIKSATPPDVDTEIWTGDIWQVPNPPSNIRTAPDGKILCTVKNKAKITLRGTSNIKDKNGEWLYTDYCGQIGFIHSTQVELIDGSPAG